MGDSLPSLDMTHISVTLDAHRVGQVVPEAGRYLRITAIGHWSVKGDLGVNLLYQG